MGWSGWRKTAFASKTDGFQKALQHALEGATEVTRVLETYVHTSNAADQEMLAETAGEREHAGDNSPYAG